MSHTHTHTGVLNSEVVKYTNVAFGTDESVLFREVSLIQGVLIERFHCIQVNPHYNVHVSHTHTHQHIPGGGGGGGV